MEILVPDTFTLTSSNVSESTYSEWNSTTSYSVGDIVKVSYESDGITEHTPHRLYEALTANTGKYPPSNDTDWLYLSSTNRWKMFDDYVNTQTENTDSIEVELTCSKCTGIGLANVDGGSIAIELTDNSSGDVYTTTVNLSDYSGSISWSEYFFGDFAYKDYKVIPIPWYISQTLKVTINAKSSGGTAKCGKFVVGDRHFIGYTKYGLGSGILDYSKKDTNDFGETYLKQGNFAKRLTLNVFVRSGAFDGVHRIMTDIRGTAVFFNANNDSVEKSSLEMYGFVREFQLLYESCRHCICSATLEGLI